jgi:hypothetical protein
VFRFSFFVLRSSFPEDAMRLLLSLALCAVMTSSAAVATASPAEPHLRPQDDRLRQLLRDGSARSATLRSLVDRIEANRVIVYLRINPLMKPNLSGMLTWMTRAGDYRYVRVSISPDLSPDQIIATIAHELQHAAEVIDDASVVDEKTLAALYRRIGTQHSASVRSQWETDAAQRTGFQVRQELVSAPAGLLARNAAKTR